MLFAFTETTLILPQCICLFLATYPVSELNSDQQPRGYFWDLSLRRSPFQYQQIFPPYEVCKTSSWNLKGHPGCFSLVLRVLGRPPQLVGLPGPHAVAVARVLPPAEDLATPRPALLLLAVQVRSINDASFGSSHLSCPSSELHSQNLVLTLTITRANSHILTPVWFLAILVYTAKHTSEEHNLYMRTNSFCNTWLLQTYANYSYKRTSI